MWNKTLSFLVIGNIFFWAALSPVKADSNQSMFLEQVSTESSQEWVASSTEEAISCRLSRVNLLVGFFAEMDLGILSIKVKPYVELRFNRR